jgi:hypothetical protein
MRKVVTALKESTKIYVDIMWFHTAPNGVEYLAAQESYQTSIIHIDMYLKEHSVNTIRRFKHELMRNNIAAIEAER